MKHWRFPRTAIVLFFAVLGQSAIAQSVVRINGTGSGTGGMRLLAKAFMQKNPDVTVTVEPALGSSGGINALISGHIELAVSNRKPNSGELAKTPLLSTEYAHTPFVVAVHRDLGVTALTSSQLAGLYAAGATYPNGKRARPILRLSDAGDTALIKSFSPEVSVAVDEASKRRGMLNADTDTESADMVEQTPGAFSVSTLALIMSEGRPLRALVIDGKTPTVDNLIDGSYPYFKSLHLIVRADAGPETTRFATFVRSPEGRALLRANGHAPL